MKINNIFNKIRIILCAVATLMLISSISWATTYYVSNNGSDSNSGTSSSSPWRFISKVNNTSFYPGDNVLLERGGSWAETLNLQSSGTSGNYITVAAYGSGAKPIINCNPGSLQFGVLNNGRDWIIYENIDVYGDTDSAVTGPACFRFEPGSTNCIVRYCIARNMGNGATERGAGVGFVGGVSNITISDCNIYGNGRHGISIWQNSSSTPMDNIIIEKNIIRDAHHTVGIDFQSDGGSRADISNTIVRYNRFYDTQSEDIDPVIYADGDSVCDISNLRIYGNMFYDVYGRSLAFDTNVGPAYIYNNVFYRASTSGYDHIDIADNSETVAIINNIFYDTYAYFIHLGSTTNKTVDYNCYYNTVGSGLNRIGSNTYSTSQWSSYVSATGFDTHGMYDNPDMTNPAGDDFTISTGSPCIDNGYNLGSTYGDAINPLSSWPESVTTLNQDDYGSGWDIGAFIYGSGSPGSPDPEPDPEPEPEPEPVSDTTPPAIPSGVSLGMQ